MEQRSQNILDSVHQHLTAVDHLIARLRAMSPRDSVDVVELYELMQAVWEMGGEGLGLDAATLDKIERAHGRLKQPAALNAAARMRTYLLNLDRDFARFAASEPMSPLPDEYAMDEDAEEPGSLHFNAIGWRSIPNRQDVRETIYSVSALLDDVCRHVERSNLPDGEQALTKIERAQLIAILETTIAVLKAPMVERGLLTRAGKSLGDAAVKTAEREVQQGLGEIMSMSRKGLLEILRIIFS